MILCYLYPSGTNRLRKGTMEKITNLRQSFANASEAVRNQLARQFTPLVNKIVAQQQHTLKTDWNTLVSMGFEGLAIAMNTYDPERSGMTFTQYAAFSILNNIRNCSCTELHTVKLTSYTQDQIRKAKEAAKQAENNAFNEGMVVDATPAGIGTTTFTSVSISCVTNPNGDNDNMNREMRYGVYESAKFADGDCFEQLKAEVDANCNPTDAYCFYHYFGICGYEEKQVNELAEEFNVTSGRISQRLKKVINHIKKNEDLCENLAGLLER